MWGIRRHIYIIHIFLDFCRGRNKAIIGDKEKQIYFSKTIHVFNIHIFFLGEIEKIKKHVSFVRRVTKDLFIYLFILFFIFSQPPKKYINIIF